MRFTLAAVFTAAVLAAAGAGWAAGQAGWKVFATGQDSGEFYLSASASADVKRAGQLAVRAVGKGMVELDYTLTCRGNREFPAGSVWVLTVASSNEGCTLYASAAKDGSGSLRVQLLRK